MKVLVLNAGSTSVKYQLYEMDTETRLAYGKIERVGSASAQLSHSELSGPKLSEACAAPDARAAIDKILALLVRDGGPLPRLEDIAAVGHRVVHGGERLVRPMLATLNARGLCLSTCLCCKRAVMGHTRRRL